MSTKIYNGLRTGRLIGTDIHRLMSLIDEAVTPVIQSAHDKRLGEDIFATVDAISAGTQGPFEIDPKISVWANIGKVWHGRARRMESTLRERDPLHDFTFDTSFYFAENGTFMYPICEVAGVDDALLKVPGIEEYGYWNNSDQPEHLNDAQWGERERDWREAMDGTRPLVMHLDQMRFWPGSAERAIATIPTRQERVERIAQNETIAHRLQGVELDASNIFSAMREAKEWLKTEEGQEELRRRIEFYGTQLIMVDFTPELLNERPGSFADVPLA